MTTQIVSLQEKLDRLRKASNQEKVVALLSAVEDTIQAETTEKTETTNITATAYLAVLLSLLTSLELAEKLPSDQPELQASLFYLLDVTLPYVTRAVLQSKFRDIFIPVVAVLDDASNSAVTSETSNALIRSLIGCLEATLVAQDAESWNSFFGEQSTDTVSRIFTKCALRLSLDDRPKIRRRMHEALAHVFADRPPSPSLFHPISALISEASLKALIDEVSAKGGNTSKENRQIHQLHLMQVIVAAGQWHEDSQARLLESLLPLISEKFDTYTRMASLDLFTTLFQYLADNHGKEKLEAALNGISAQVPSLQSIQLIPSWLAVIAAGYARLATINPLSYKSMPKLYSVVFPFLESDVQTVRQAACSTLLSLNSEMLPHLSSLTSQELDVDAFREVALLVQDGFSVRFRASFAEVCEIQASLISKLPSFCEILFLDAIKLVVKMRSDSSFKGTSKIDLVIGVAIQVLGPRNFLNLFPLNLTSTDSKQPGRAWLLPILRTHIRNAELGHFFEHFVPMSSDLYDSIVAEEEGVDESEKSSVRGKIFRTLVHQIWDLLPGYCTLPTDLPKVWNKDVLELLANVLYSQVDLRATICKALTILVQSNKLMKDESLTHSRHGLSDEEVVVNIKLLQDSCSNVLAVLFNIFNQTLPQFRIPISDCIKAFLSIDSSEGILTTYDKVVALFKSSANERIDSNALKKPDAMPPVSLTALDIIVAMLPYLPESIMPQTWELILEQLNTSKPLMQKKGYKAFVAFGRLPSGRSQVLSQIDLNSFISSTGQVVTAANRKERLFFLEVLVDIIPQSDLHILAVVLPEVVIGTKNANEKARTLAYDLLVRMGNKMHEGGIVSHSKISGMKAGAVDVEASLSEYFTMVAAGLASKSSTMISATITALSRLLFEFKEKLLHDLLDTIDIFIASTNREIARSAIGFVKVSLVALSPVQMESRLPKVIPNLMTWAHEPKGHFRAKVKRIIERLLRRFGHDTVAKYMPEADKKLLTNIRKTREREKKAKKGEIVEDDVEDTKVHETKVHSAYEAALYGSDSDDASVLDGDENARISDKGRDALQYLVEGADDPLDLLDPESLGRVSSQDKKKKAKFGTLEQRAGFKRRNDGRFVVDDERHPSMAEDDLKVDSDEGDEEGQTLDPRMKKRSVQQSKWIKKAKRANETSTVEKVKPKRVQF